MTPAPHDRRLAHDRRPPAVGLAARWRRSDHLRPRRRRLPASRTVGSRYHHERCLVGRVGGDQLGADREIRVRRSSPTPPTSAHGVPDDLIAPRSVLDHVTSADAAARRRRRGRVRPSAQRRRDERPCRGATSGAVGDGWRPQPATRTHPLAANSPTSPAARAEVSDRRVVLTRLFQREGIIRPPFLRLPVDAPPS